MKIRFPSSTTERREDETFWDAIKILGEVTGARWVTFAWRLALWMLTVYQRRPIAWVIDAMLLLNWASGDAFPPLEVALTM